MFTTEILSDVSVTKKHAAQWLKHSGHSPLQGSFFEYGAFIYTPLKINMSPKKGPFQ